MTHASDDRDAVPAPGRRAVLRSASLGGALVAGGALLTACGGDEPATSAAGPSTSAGSAGSPAPSTPPATSADAGSGGEALVAASEVPVGGGVILKDAKLVVTQPEAGSFKAFDANCTHKGCLVTSVEGGTINCSCHGSKFALADGSVKGGPAQAPLPSVDVTLDGDQVVKG